MDKFKTKQVIIWPAAALAAAGVLLVLVINWPGGQFNYLAAGVASTSTSSTTTPLSPPPVTHLKTPRPVKAVYMTACAAATPSFRTHLLGLINTTEFNSIVIDLKDYSGTIAFPVTDTTLAGVEGGGCHIADLPEFIRELHRQNIYVIGRITVFQDPFYAKRHPELAVKRASDGGLWQDKKGISYIDVGAKPFWDYIVKISEEAYAIGVDELNFDYVRFPSDGNMRDIALPYTGSRLKAEVLEEFFAYLNKALEPTEAIISADLFGMTTTAEPGNDLGIGQEWERALPYFDYLAPMVYPSHYPPHFYGYANPNTVPYEIIKIAMDSAVAKTLAASSSPNKIRPWLQDFDYGGNYDVAEVQAQIKASYDAGVDSWMMWDPGNKYTRPAYQPEL